MIFFSLKEDFQPMNYNFRLAQDITDQVCNSSLKTVEDEAAKLYRVSHFFYHNN